ncbi:MAG TPA: 4Fe-4S binding protein [Bellilinea sp.]|nr:4Fe-4S binding protein [Bellilinea sp.]
MRLLFTSRRFKGESFDPGQYEPNELIMFVDLDRCIGCGACALACEIEHEQALGSSEPMRPILTAMGPESRMTCLPTSCRHCQTPCEYQSDYNFWIMCPSLEARAATHTFCDSCVTRIADDLYPACAMRCTMKTIYFGRPDEIALVLADKRLREKGDIEFEG